MEILFDFPMSRQTKYELMFPKGIKCAIALQKSTEATTGFKQGKDGRSVRTIKVLTTDDAKPTSLEDIEELVEWGELQTYFPYRDESGEASLLEIDKKALQAMFKNSNSMKVEGTMTKTCVMPFMFTDSHYFVNVQRNTKTKTLPAADLKVYTVIYHYLMKKDLYLLVKFISSNREKYAVLYADPASSGIRMSILVHSTYQRERNGKYMTKVADPVMYGEKLFKEMELSELDPEDIKDDYEERVRKYIEESRERVKGGRPRERIKVEKTVSTEVDILDQILAL